MGRTAGALAKSHVRIVAPSKFAAAVRALADRGLNGEVGVRAVGRSIEIPASRLSEWMQGRRHGLSREQFSRLHDGVLYSTQGHVDFPDGLTALYESVAPPADGLGFWPENPRPKARHTPSAPVFFEDIFGAAADRVARGDTPAEGSPFWDDEIWQRHVFGRPLYVTEKVLRVLQSHFPAFPIGYGSTDGAPSLEDTRLGLRCRIWIDPPLGYAPQSSGRRAGSTRRR